MTTQRIAIIGCGYVGSAVGRALAERSHDVVGTTRTSARLDEIAACGVQPVVVELHDAPRMRELLQNRDVVYLTIAAGRGGDYRATYLDGARALLNAVQGTHIGRVIYTSSTRVYGRHDGSWVDEDTPPEPADEHGRILAETERALLERAPSNRPAVITTVVRLGGIHGPGRELSQRIRRAAGTTRHDGDAYVNLSYLEYIVTALSALLGQPYHGVLNLVDDDPVPRRELYGRVHDKLGLPRTRWLDSTAGPNLGKRVSNTRIKQVLHLQLPAVLS